MKKEYTGHREASLLEVILNDIREQGSKDVSKPVFNALLSVIAMSLVLFIAFLSDIVIDALKAYLSAPYQFLGLLLFCFLMVKGAKSFVSLWLTLWTLTKEGEK